MAKPTIAALQAKITELTAHNESMRSSLATARAEKGEAEDSLKTSREHFDDIKQRLHAAETSNQFMRGYLARVQEDDVVREDLLTVGEPDGEQRMVPKRKATTFERPSDFTEHKEDRGLYGGYASRERRKPRHWITY